jgi:hypothetical protein
MARKQIRYNAKLRIRAGDVTIVVRQEPQCADAGHIRQDSHAIKFDLVCPARSHRNVARNGEHRSNERRKIRCAHDPIMQQQRVPPQGAELFGRIVRAYVGGSGLQNGLRVERQVTDMSSETRAAGSRGLAGAGPRTLMVWQLLSAILLLVMGGIHLYLVFNGVGGLLGVLFVLNAVGGLALAIAIVVLRRRLLLLATVLSLLFMVGTLLALVLALTVGLFGIHEVMTFQLVPTTLVVESIGTIVLAVTTVLAFRPQRAA